MMNEFLAKVITTQENILDQTKYADLKEKAKTQGCFLKVWSDCDGSHHVVPIFKNQLLVLMCDKHFEVHAKMLMLHYCGDNMDGKEQSEVESMFLAKFESNDIDRLSCTKFLQIAKPDGFYIGLDNDSLVERLCEHL